MQLRNFEILALCAGLDKRGWQVRELLVAAASVPLFSFLLCDARPGECTACCLALAAHGGNTR